MSNPSLSNFISCSGYPNPRLIAIVLITICLFQTVQSQSYAVQQINEWELRKAIFSLINEYREANGLQKVVEEYQLKNVADNQAKEAARTKKQTLQTFLDRSTLSSKLPGWFNNQNNGAVYNSRSGLYYDNNSCSIFSKMILDREFRCLLLTKDLKKLGIGIGFSVQILERMKYPSDEDLLLHQKEYLVSDTYNQIQIQYNYINQGNYRYKEIYEKRLELYQEKLDDQNKELLNLENNFQGRIEKQETCLMNEVALSLENIQGGALNGYGYVHPQSQFHGYHNANSDNASILSDDEISQYFDLSPHIQRYRARLLKRSHRGSKSNKVESKSNNEIKKTCSIKRDTDGSKLIYYGYYYVTVMGLQK